MSEPTVRPMTEVEVALDRLAAFISLHQGANGCQWPEACSCVRCAFDVVNANYRRQMDGPS